MIIYIDLENVGLHAEPNFIVEQISSYYNYNEKNVKVFAYFNCILYPQIKESIESLGIVCRSTVIKYGKKKIKNLADLVMCIDIIDHINKDNNINKVVIVSGDNHFADMAIRLKARGIHLTIASASGNVSSNLKRIADEYICICTTKRRAFSSENLLNLMESNLKKLDYDDPLSLMDSSLNIISNSSFKKLFMENGIYFSNFSNIFKQYLKDYNPKKYGYNNVMEHFVAASSTMEYCVAHQKYSNEMYKHKIFNKNHISPEYEMIAPTPLIDVNTRAHYLSISRLPQSFNMEQISELLYVIASNPSLKYISSYARFLENIGVIFNSDAGTAIFFSEALEDLIKNHIRKNLIENGIDVNENLLTELVKYPTEFVHK